MRSTERYDVAILGGGLAGLSLARHLLLETGCRVVLLERRRELPPRRQKVGESTVQVAGYYFSKVLDLEAHLLNEQLMKYNLRFYWPSAAGDNRGFEDYAKSYIREFSNIASYQLDRNRFEGELLRLNRDDRRFRFESGVSRVDVDLTTDRERCHRIGFRQGGRNRQVEATWVIDATGRGKALSRRLELERDNPIHHASIFWWVDGLVDIEKLTGLTPRQRRLAPERRQGGHLPTWLATNHFMTEGAWFWVIPLRGKTSLGLVYDTRVVRHEEVFSVAKATRWVCDRFPLFARDLPSREVVDRGGLPDFSYDCLRTLSADRWAITGEAGRFSDPLYSPGSDLISIHNTLIVDAIRADREEGAAALRSRCSGYEQLMQAVYRAYEPSYAASYDALGDQETFNLKYGWELSVYFAFYVFPFVNDLFTDKRFLISYLRAFARLGPWNEGLQHLLSAFFQWKKERGEAGPPGPDHFDFTHLEPLARARDTFYEVGRSVSESREILERQLENLEELALFVSAWVASRMLGEERALHHRAFVESIDPARPEVDPLALARRWAELRDTSGEYRWSFDPGVLAETLPGVSRRDRAPRTAPSTSEKAAATSPQTVSAGAAS